MCERAKCACWCSPSSSGCAPNWEQTHRSRHTCWAFSRSSVPRMRPHRAMVRPTSSACSPPCGGTCVAWTRRSWPSAEPICKAASCKTRNSPGRCSRRASLLRPSMPSLPWPSAPAASPGPQAGVGKCGCGARKARCYTRSGRPIPTRCTPSPSARTNARWPAGASMAASSSGKLTVVPCSGRAGRRRAPPAWLLLRMAACSPVGDLMRPSGSGTQSWAPSSRRCRIPGRSSRWPGAWMGAGSPVVTSRARFGCGRGSRPASASWHGTIKLWELESGRCLQTLEEHTERVQALAWSPDGGTLASGGWDTTIRLWDGQECTSRGVLQGHSGIVYGLAFTPDSRHLLSGSDDGTLRLWDVERAQCVRVLKGYAAFLYDLAWSPDGTRLASAGSETVVSIWEVVSARRYKVLEGHRLTVYGLAWSPDGSLLASSGWDSAIRLWDRTTGTG